MKILANVFLIIEATSNLVCGTEACCMPRGDLLWRFTFLQVDHLHVFHNCNDRLLVNAEDKRTTQYMYGR